VSEAFTFSGYDNIEFGFQISMVRVWVEHTKEDAIAVQSEWQLRSPRQRCRLISRVRYAIVDAADSLIQFCTSAQRTDPVETITGELIPLCDALKFIGKFGPGLLKPRYWGLRGRPLWLWGVQSEVHRQPLGDVLILAAWNYPIFLPGVQIAQALAAGNRVWLKPAPGCEAVSAELVNAFWLAGVPTDSLGLLPAEPQAAQAKIDAGVDLVVLTGGANTGRSVMMRCAATLTPAIMELSGCDAVIVGPGADLDVVARAVAFGLSFNSGATCIGPRRIVVAHRQHDRLVEAIAKRLVDMPALKLHPTARQSTTEVIVDAMRRGAIDCVLRETSPPLDSAALDRPLDSLAPTVLDGVGTDWKIACSDTFAPVASIIIADSDDEMVKLVNESPYRLAAAVFADKAWASPIAARLNVGHVSINDLIFPTADPRVPFGGCGSSGYGVTRGAEGLLAMTRPKVIARHRGGLYLQFRPRTATDRAMLLRVLRWTHGRLWSK